MAYLGTQLFWRSAFRFKGFSEACRALILSKLQKLRCFMLRATQCALIKGFHTCIREQFTEPGTASYYQQFE